jgi:hypothetical protein
MALIRDLEQQRATAWGGSFDRLYRRLQTRWDSLNLSKALYSFKDIRDKLVAHKDLTFVGGTYKPLLDIGTLGLTWGDMTMTIERMRRITELINNLVRGAGFTWDDLEEQHYQIANAFWNEVPKAPSSKAIENAPSLEPY